MELREVMPFPCMSNASPEMECHSATLPIGTGDAGDLYLQLFTACYVVVFFFAVEVYLLTLLTELLIEDSTFDFPVTTRVPPNG
jgi:hypothetical protein